LPLLRRPHVVQTSSRNSKSRRERLSPSKAHRFTTKSSMKTCVFTPPHETGILVAHSIPDAGSHDTRLGRESSWPLAPSGTHFFLGWQGFDHGVGHSLLLLYDAKAHCSKNSNYFNGLFHYPSNTLYKFILNYNMLYHSYNYLIFLPFLARH